MIEGAVNNIGNMYISDSPANMSAGNRHIIRPGEAYEITLDDSSADDDLVFMDLSELYFDGANTSDKLVVSYIAEKSVNY